MFVAPGEDLYENMVRSILHLAACSMLGTGMFLCLRLIPMRTDSPACRLAGRGTSKDLSIPLKRAIKLEACWTVVI